MREVSSVSVRVLIASDVVESPVYPVRLTILPQGEDASRAWEVIVLAARSDGTVIGRQRARGGFLAGTTVYTRLVLEDCCLAVAATCENQETCVECACVETTTIDPNDDAPALFSEMLALGEREAQEIAANVWPLVDEGEVRPVMARTYRREEAAQAHAQMESGELVGKIVLEVV